MPTQTAHTQIPETDKATAAGGVSFADRRREPRIPCDAIPARGRIGENQELAAARVMDISTSGVRLAMNAWLEVGSEVTVWFSTTVATGRVRYCRPDRDGSLEVGLCLSDVLNIA